MRVVIRELKNASYEEKPLFEPYDIGPIDCGNCGNRAPFRVVAEDNSQIVTHTYEHEEHPWGTLSEEVEQGWVQRMLICSSCKSASLDRVYFRDGYPDEGDPEILYPQPISIPDGVPDSVAREYRAALKERKGNANGYAALLGRVLDAVCTDRHIAQRHESGRPIFLGARFKMLTEQETLTTVQGAIGLRNVAAHADLGDLTADDVPYLEALIRYVLDHLYIIPAINRRAIEAEQARRQSGRPDVTLDTRDVR